MVMYWDGVMQEKDYQTITLHYTLYLAGDRNLNKKHSSALPVNLKTFQLDV